MMNEKDQAPESPLKPFEKIGLCFSGGGYRATAFSLGVLSYLNRIKFKDKPLVDNIVAISSVSGGSITGAYFSKSQVDEIPFNKFYHTLYNFLKDDKLLETAVANLQDTRIWNQTKRRSLINSFALAYEKLLFGGTTMADLLKLKDHSKYICINATEFSFGLAFRFQNTGTFGNYRLRSSELNLFKEQIKISDAVASSSCFPVGFEPMVFPDDYSQNHADLIYKNLKQRADYVHGVGIMDGGIVDNQGIGSMVLMDTSKIAGMPLDLLFVNDVGSYMMDAWVPEDAPSIDKGNKRSLQSIYLKILNYFKLHFSYYLILIAGLVILIANSMNLFGCNDWVAIYITGGVLTGAGIILTVLGGLASLGRKLADYLIRNFFKKKIPKALVDEVQTFKHLDIGLIKKMLSDRISSTLVMVNDIFLKQIRRLNYNLLKSTPRYKDRIIVSTVYELNGKETTLSDTTIDGQNSELQRIHESALIASQTPTTLWWDDVDLKLNRQNNLIACGQYTTCYNLMKYILDLKKVSISSNEIDELYESLANDWKLFKENPTGFVVD